MEKNSKTALTQKSAPGASSLDLVRRELFRLNRGKISKELQLEEFKNAYITKLHSKLAPLIVKKEFASNVPEYIIEMFDNDYLREACILLTKIISMDVNKTFSKQVNAYEFGIPDYYTIVTNPMDFGTIYNNLICGVYTPFFTSKTNYKEVWADNNPLLKDINQVWENALKYNGDKSGIAVAMEWLRNRFNKNMVLLRNGETLSNHEDDLIKESTPKTSKPKQSKNKQTGTSNKPSTNNRTSTQSTTGISTDKQLQTGGVKKVKTQPSPEEKKYNDATFMDIMDKSGLDSLVHRGQALSENFFKLNAEKQKEMHVRFKEHNIENFLDKVVSEQAKYLKVAVFEEIEKEIEEGLYLRTKDVVKETKTEFLDDDRSIRNEKEDLNNQEIIAETFFTGSEDDGELNFN